MISAIIGGTAGGCEISVTYPAEYIKTVIQLDKSDVKPTAREMVRKTYKTNGVRGFYRGYSTLLFFQIPRNYIAFGAFTFLENNVFT